LKTKYIIRLDDTPGRGGKTTDYYGGGFYFVQGEQYPVIGSRENARQYTSKAMAARGVEAINKKCAFPCVCQLEEV